MRSLILAVFAFVAVSYGSATPASAAPRVVTITAHGFAFIPAIVELERGTTYDLVLKSSDGSHGLDVPELGLHHVVVTSQARTVTITPTTAGTFVAHCTQNCGVGNATMALKFVVSAGAPTAPKAGAETPVKPAKAGNPCSAPPS